MSFLTKIFGDADEKYLKSIKSTIDKINNLEPKFEAFSDEQLKQNTQSIKREIEQGKGLDEILPEAFALVREASKRTLNQRHFDVQIMGGIALHQGKIAEMITGEGKTLAATLPAYLNALEAKGAHIVTVNDYLSRRDTVWMGQIYHLLGLSVGCLNHEQAFLYDPDYKKPDEEKDKIRDEFGAFRVVEDFLRPCLRKEAYQADITYGTNNEFGFDYLRDNMAYDTNQLVQRKLNFAILDEIDFILIDEARTPLIISAPDTKASEMYKQFTKLIPRLNKETDFEIEEDKKVVTLTEQGIRKIEQIFGTGNIYSEAGIDYLYHLEQALRAYVLFKRDVDYVVKNGEVIIVDEFTGRLMPGRRWSGGLHQAVEAKEKVEIQPESRTLATITFQNYFKLYQKLSGMTGTAVSSAEEFDRVYGLDVISIPTNKPMQRNNLDDVVFKNEKGKLIAIVREIKQRHEQGQPILIGTRSIEKNEILSKLFKKENLAHQVLNAKNHEREAEIIAQAGKLGAITVATNMAGRGVDIILGGYPLSTANSEQQTADNKKEENSLYKKWEKEHKKTVELGGLHIIGTERHEARRIDNQLRGRAGRQGDPGSSRFFLSLEDELLRVFGGDRIKGLMEKLNVPEDEPISASLISRAVESAQAKIEGMHFDVRKNLLDYDNVMSKHRDVFYKKRREILEASPDQFRELLIKVLEKNNLSKDNFLSREKDIDDNFLKTAKFFFLRTMDSFWIHHLEDMSWLRESVRLRAYGKLDPLVEYKTEGYKMFQEMMVEIDRRNADIATSIQGQSEVNNILDKKEVLAVRKKIGRNDPCPCGAAHSDGRPKKYKHCCGKAA